VAEPPTRAVEFTLPGSNNLRATRVATEAHSREGEEEGHYRETAQADSGTEVQGTEVTPHHQGLPPQAWGPVQMAIGSLKPYSGFDEALKCWGPSGDITATRDLRWQRDVKGDTQKIKQFQEVVGGLQEFRTYLLMKPGSAFVTVLHSPMKFVAISEATQHLQGRYVGFVGDRTSTKDPTPVVLPQQSTWKWDTKTASTDAAALEAHYSADPTLRGKLWAPEQAEGDEWSPIMAPRLLAVPLVLFRAIREEQKPLMPHEVRGLVLTIIADADVSNKARDDWQLVLSWCLLAAQQDANGNSYLGVPMDAVTEGDDDYFETWIDQWLDLVFGPRPNVGSVGTTGPWGNTVPQTAPSQVSALMATEVGKGVALGLRAMGHLQRDLSQPGGDNDSEAKGYTKDDIAAVYPTSGHFSMLQKERTQMPIDAIFLPG